MILEIGGSYFAHVWLEQVSFLFPFGLILMIVALYTIVANLHHVSQNNALAIYGSYSTAFILMMVVWVFFLHRQLFGSIEFLLTASLILSVFLMAYQSPKS
jgi:drug/metabolite transporter superfamily protein YnfA